MTIETTPKNEKPKSTAQSIQTWMNAPTMQSALSAALTGYMSQSTFAAQCYIAAQNPDLAKCTPQSLFRAFLECAQMGLLPGKHHGHVALIPQKDGTVRVQPQWQGYKFLMERQPGVRRVRGVLVHARDTFAMEHGEPRHEYDPFDGSREFEHPDVAAKNKRECGLRGGYLVIEYDDDRDTEYHFVGADKIHRNRRCAQTQDVWTRWFEEMALKTVYRDAWARRVISIDPQLAQRLGKADEIDNATNENDPMRAEVTIAPKQTASRVEALAAQLDDSLPDMSKEASPTREPITAEHEEVKQ